MGEFGLYLSAYLVSWDREFAPKQSFKGFLRQPKVSRMNLEDMSLLGQVCDVELEARYHTDNESLIIRPEASISVHYLQGVCYV